jgi:hypothetical protein
VLHTRPLARPLVVQAAPLGQFALMGLLKHLSQIGDWLNAQKDRYEAWVWALGILVALCGGLAIAFAWATPALRIFAPFSYVLAGLAVLVLLAALWAAIMIAMRTRHPAVTAAAQFEPQRPQRRPPGARRPNYKVWEQIDPLNLAQASWLWADKEPPPGGVPVHEPEYQMLKQAAEEERLELLDHLEDIRGINAQPTATVRRNRLKTYATKSGQRPPFLFPAERGQSS